MRWKLHSLLPRWFTRFYIQFSFATINQQFSTLFPSVPVCWQRNNEVHITVMCCNARTTWKIDVNDVKCVVSLLSNNFNATIHYCMGSPVGKKIQKKKKNQKQNKNCYCWRICESNMWVHIKPSITLLIVTIGVTNTLYHTICFTLFYAKNVPIAMPAVVLFTKIIYWPNTPYELPCRIFFCRSFCFIFFFILYKSILLPGWCVDAPMNTICFVTLKYILQYGS